jgi:CheY-like chemotaxis protein
MKKRNVLVVDDDREYLRLVESIVGQAGIEVCYATSGEEAVGVLKEGSFAIMITDLNMPGMDGFELARVAIELSPAIVIVMITGDISPRVLHTAAEAGISEVLAKPISLGRFLSIVRGKRAAAGVDGT